LQFKISLQGLADGSDASFSDALRKALIVEVQNHKTYSGIII
jgi:hypothetical protein